LKVTLRKVTKVPLDFEVKFNEITFKGYLEYYSGKLILLHAKIEGLLDKPCDFCSEDIKIPVNETVEFFISDGIYEDEENIDLDVVESINGIVDIEELLNSEIELIKSDYHSCENCK
jgi:uncharacterized metal-binding protein YceD (DUF177 family)